MEKLDLIRCLEKISSHFPNRILKIEGFVSKENQKKNWKLSFSRVLVVLQRILLKLI